MKWQHKTHTIIHTKYTYINTVIIHLCISTPWLPHHKQASFYRNNSRVPPLFFTKPHQFILWIIQFLWVFLIFYIWFLDFFQFQIFVRTRWMVFQLAWWMKVIFLSGVLQLLGHQILYSEFFIMFFLLYVYIEAEIWLLFSKVFVFIGNWIEVLLLCGFLN